MKKLFTLMLLTLVTTMGSWAGYIPTKRVTTFESGKVYMLYNTCVTSSDTRTGFIYLDGSMKKNTSFNPLQFATNNTAYLWRVTTGENNHIALQNVSTSKYIDFRLGANDSDPNNLFLYPWGTNQDNQSAVNSQNEADPSTNTEYANITFDSNKVFIMGNPSSGGNDMWNGNPGDIVLWSTGHPFAFYEVEERALARADVGTYRFQTTALTTGASDYSITKDGSGNVTISPNSGSYGATSGRFCGTVVVRINVPENTTAGVLCQMRRSSGDAVYSQGLYMAVDRKLQTCWGNADGAITARTDGTTLATGEHTLIYTTGESGAVVYVDGTQGFTDSGLKAGDISYKAIYIPATYAQYVTEVYFYSANVCAEYCSLISEECAKYMHASQITGTTAEVASDKTLILDANKDWTSLTGTGTVLQESAAITTNVAGNLSALTLKATAGTLTYTGTSLNGTTLDGVILGGSARINTSNTVNIKNLAGNNLNNTSKNYAFVGSGTINFWGTCDLTKKSDGTVCNSANIGYDSSGNVIIKAGANVTAGVVLNSVTISSNAPITVEATATLTAVGSTHVDNRSLLVYSTNLTNNGTINLNADGRNSIVSVLSGSGTLNVASGSSISAPSVPNTMTLTGAGDVVLTTFPSSTAPTLSSWTGTVQFPATETYQENLTALFNAWGNTGSTIKLNSVGGKFYQSETVNPTLNILSGETLSIGNASSDYTPELTGVDGAGALNFASGATISVPSIPSTLTLTGAGVVKLTTFPTSSAPTLSSWTGAFEFASPALEQADLAAIFNAWGNANSTIKLHSVSGWLPGLEEGKSYTVNPTLEILEGQTLTINNGISSTTPVLKKITGAGNLEQTWSGGSSYTLKIATLTDFTGTLKGTNKTIVVEKLVCADPPYADALLIKTSGDVSLTKIYVDLVETTAYTWETKTVKEVTGIYVSTFNIVQLYRDMAIEAVTPYSGLIGTGVGKYTIYLLDKKSQKYIEYYTTDDFVEAINAWEEQGECSIPTVTINQPTSGFYRFKAAARSKSDASKNWYMGGNADGIYSASTTDAKASDVNTIFYLEKDGNGYHPISYFSGLRSAGTAYHNVDDNSNFTLSQAIKEDDTTELLGEYKMVNGSNNTIVMWSDAYLRSLEDAQNNDWSGWTIEPVEEIPVTFKKSALGYATFFTPAPLRIPKNGSGEYDIHAYVCKMDGTKLTFYDITNVEDEVGRIIPVNTAVMLYNSTVKDGEDDEVVVNFTISSKDDVVIDNNSFRETLATVTPETLSTFDGKQHTIYSLRTKTKTDGSKVMGFYERTSTSNCAGFKAWLMTEKEAQARNFTIYFDGEEAPTGIIEALGLQNDNVEIYDLNGRKLSSYKKGINIVNGKKVMVK